jgi:hypothetical protein
MTSMLILLIPAISAATARLLMCAIPHPLSSGGRWLVRLAAVVFTE